MSMRAGEKKNGNEKRKNPCAHRDLIRLNYLLRHKKNHEKNRERDEEVKKTKGKKSGGEKCESHYNEILVSDAF
jgi:stress-induced morphogen